MNLVAMVLYLAVIVITLVVNVALNDSQGGRCVRQHCRSCRRRVQRNEVGPVEPRLSCADRGRIWMPHMDPGAFRSRYKSGRDVDASDDSTRSLPDQLPLSGTQASGLRSTPRARTHAAAFAPLIALGRGGHVSAYFSRPAAASSSGAMATR